MTYHVGISDDRFIRGNIPMTKAEIRILVLARAKINPGDTVIDIGAGTGSLSVEAALQSGSGEVYAIEREPEGIELIKRNAAKFTAAVRPVPGFAPEALTGLPQADVIFIGGSGGKLDSILTEARHLLKPGGRLVVTAVTVETLQRTLAFLDNCPEFAVEASCVQVTRLRKVASSHMMQALNPIYIIAAEMDGKERGERVEIQEE